MLPYDDALTSIMQAVQALTPCELLTADAGGLVLAEDAHAHWDMPRCDNSAMDGYAIAGYSSTQDVPLAIIGASYAGHPFPASVPAGKAIR
ncbi:MAG: molybdopterin molybdenumtransferase MoeA, partial [Candidatus Marinimicrobia bacterium]|nr:molybdopterin molybdenumtransferase MoeA [Candidatus Neomarinimicrobiota bacterium]